MISFKNVSKSFENKKILDNINIDIEENTITCLIGESGCGKTTLLKMINRLYEPTKGTITINNENILKKAEADYKKHLESTAANIDELYRRGKNSWVKYIVQAVTGV